MFFNVSNIIKGSEEHIEISENIDIPELNSLNNNVFVKLEGNLTNTGKEYVLQGRLKADINLNCDLCLKPFNYKMDFDINEIFSKEADNENSRWEFIDNTIDLKPAVITNILLNRPMKSVCSQNCKGLCQNCGKDLNEGSCDCNKSYINPQFEKLITLFNDKEV